MTLRIGKPAPDFKLKDQNEKEHSLADYRGRPIVLYFYPEDDTPGCTTEACNFRDDYSSYQDTNAVILGVSADTVRSHARFAKKYELPFPLLADTEKEVINAYGVWGEKNMFGRKYDGIIRQTFIIDPDGNLAHHFEKVNAKEHSVEVLTVLESL